ncbi:MAG: hypothetical protein ABSH37_08660 [Bryobacteraceae bacterium]|jgi:hypothetical protein
MNTDKPVLFNLCSSVAMMLLVFFSKLFSPRDVSLCRVPVASRAGRRRKLQNTNLIGAALKEAAAPPATRLRPAVADSKQALAFVNYESARLLR